MKLAGQRKQVHLGVGRVEPCPAQFARIGSRTLAMERIIILILAAAVVQQGEVFDHPEVRAGLRSQQTPVQKHAQPVIATMEASMPQSMVRDQKLKQFSGGVLRRDELINHGKGLGCGNFVVDPARFYESSYTNLSDQGISGVFPDADVQRIIAVVKEIRLKAVA